MPVLLAEKDFEPWLSGSAGLELLKPAAEDLLQRLPVSKRVNSSRAADEGCDALTPCHWPQLRRRQR
jgi:putative SOS response-associated peptidase YedK